MFEDVFEPLNDIIDGGDAQEASDEWGDVWDTGEKEDMWRSSDPKDVWSVAPGVQPAIPDAPDPAPRPTTPAPLPEHDQNDECEAEDCPECEECETCDKGSGSGLFDDIFLSIC